MKLEIGINGQSKVVLYQDILKNKADGIRFLIFWRDEFRCVFCGYSFFEDGVRILVDHFIPQGSLGEDDSSNFLTICESCNNGKQAKILSGVAGRIAKKIEENNKRFEALTGIQIKFRIHHCIDDCIAIESRPPCKRCSNKLRIIKRSDGIFFWGCEQYPVCKGNASIPEEDQKKLREYLLS